MVLARLDQTLESPVGHIGKPIESRLVCALLTVISNNFCNLDEIDVPRPTEKDNYAIVLRYPGWNDIFSRFDWILQREGRQYQSFNCLDEKFVHGS